MDELIDKFFKVVADLVNAELVVTVLLVFASIVVTLAIVQMIKAMLKHTPIKNKVSSFWFKAIIFVFAFVTGYCTTIYFVDAPMVEKWAFAIAILNPFIYQGFLIYATKKKWLGVISVLKMRKLVVREGTEKVIDHDDKTMVVGRRVDDAET